MWPKSWKSPQRPHTSTEAASGPTDTTSVGGTVEEACRRQETVFDWRVENFSALPDATDYRHRSPDFDFLGRPWFLELFPNGEEELMSEGYVGLYLCLARPDPPVEVRFSLGIRPARGETKVGYENTALFEEKRRRWGSQNSVKRSMLLQRKELMPLDVLTVRATLKAELPAEELAASRDVTDPQTIPDGDLPRAALSKDKCVQVSPDVPPDLESLSRDFRRLLELEIFPDVRLRCGDREVPAHTSVLAARSRVFAATFRNRMAEGETVPVDIADVSPEVLDSFLQYLYSGEVSYLSEDAASSLYAAGDEYCVPALKGTCSDWMVRCLTPENCLRFLKLAEARGDEDFKEKVVDFVAGNLESVRRDAWSEINRDHARLALSVYEKLP